MHTHYQRTTPQCRKRRADRPTVPVAIERLMSRPGGAGFGQAMALSCILVVICAVVLVLVDRGVSGEDGLDLAF